MKEKNQKKANILKVSWAAFFTKKAGLKGFMYNIEENVGFLLAKAYRRGFGIFRERLTPFGITPPQFSLLAFLWMEDGLSQAELCEKSHVDRATMVGLIDRLEKDGLVRRMPNAGDRRAYKVCLTDRGRALEPELCGIAEEVTGLLTQKLKKSEVEYLKELLNKVRK